MFIGHLPCQLPQHMLADGRNQHQGGDALLAVDDLHLSRGADMIRLATGGPPLWWAARMPVGLLTEVVQLGLLMAE